MNMQKQPLQDRVAELQNELGGYSWRKIARRHGTNYSLFLPVLSGGNPNLHSIENMAGALNLIPLVIYSLDGDILNPGIRGFDGGKTIDNYVGKVIAHERREREISQVDLAQKSRIKPSYQLSQIEHGKAGISVGRLEKLTDALGLVPRYLVAKMPWQGIIPPSYEPWDNTIKSLQELLAVSPNRISPTEMEKIMNYTGNLGKLISALNTRIGVLINQIPKE